ncbi:MAG: tRNA uridine-5-carboxymethylaminomethyl(34) synthesis enzyme MnmG [Candidatus Krumholzibacteriia bacterium]
MVGGGHAGLEAALAAARLGRRTALLTHDRREIGRMPCNPAIGGLGKGQLVREIDALGGEMGRAIDACGIQFRLLNRRKGPAVRSPRAQADKSAYQAYMLGVVEQQPNLVIVEGEAAELLVDGAPGAGGQIAGVVTAEGRQLAAPCVIIATGTFLRGLMHVGDDRHTGGREGAASAEGLSGSLRALGFSLRRLKTGTPMRLRRNSIDYAALEAQFGDADPTPFSFFTTQLTLEQVPCHLTWTNARTHAVIRDNLHRSPLYAGAIEGRGPRYCPSVEDKVVRFADRDRHQIFLEPEGRASEEIYVNGLSTSLPADVQTALVRTIRGLEEAELLRFGYAVEYDSLPSWQVRATLESKNIDGLYFAGQILGTSGYEEAAAQGLMAGLNAARKLKNQPALIIGRGEAYIGVLVDDLTTKEILEPYRIFTSRVERRLALRCDNAEARLLPYAREAGLLTPGQLEDVERHVAAVSKLRNFLDDWRLPDPAGEGRATAADLIRRTDGSAEALLAAAPREAGAQAPDLPDFASHRGRLLCATAEAELKYEGYIAKQDKMLRQLAHLDAVPLPPALPYLTLTALSFEAREKLNRMRPDTLGQAARIDGVRQSDLAVLAVLLKRHEASQAEGPGGRP